MDRRGFFKSMVVGCLGLSLTKKETEKVDEIPVFSAKDKIEDFNLLATNGKVYRKMQIVSCDTCP